ncbi:hypothetical protein Hdeb2414_s0005g00181491 [Helianthus debilis subsp. tardiflorus]
MVQMVHEVGRRRWLKLELGFRWYPCADLVYTKRMGNAELISIFAIGQESASSHRWWLYVFV